MARRLGRGVSISLGEETAYGAGQAAPAMHVIPRSTLRVSPTRPLDQSPEVRYDPNPAEPIRGAWELDAELGQVVSADVTPFLLKLFLGAAPFLGSTSQTITCTGVQVDDTVTLTVNGTPTVFTAKADENIPSREFKCSDAGAWDDDATAGSLKNVIDGHADFAATVVTNVVTASAVPAAPIMGGSSEAGRLAVAAVAPHFWNAKAANAALKSAIAEKYDAHNNKHDLYKGLVVYGLRMTWAKRTAGPVVIWTWRLRSIGADPLRNQAARYDPTPTEYTAKRHANHDVSMTVDGVGDLAKFITQLDLDLSWEVHDTDGISGNAFADYVDLGELTIEGTIRARRPENDAVYALCDDAPHTLVITSPQPGTPSRYIRLTLPEVKIEQVEATDESDRGPVDESFQLAPYYSVASQETSVLFEVANDRTTL